MPLCNYVPIVNLHWLEHPNIQRLEGMAGVGWQAYNRYVVFSSFHDSGVCDVAVVSIIAQNKMKIITRDPPGMWDEELSEP